jgi:hypothetical protein
MHPDAMEGAMTGLDPGAFKEVKIGDRPVIQPFLAAAGRVSSDYNFATMYAWGGIYGLRWALRRDRLLVYSEKDDILLMPVGAPISAPEMCVLSDELRRAGKSGDFAIVDAEFVAHNPSLSGQFDLSVDPDNADYVYSTRALVELKGNKLHRKKNLLSQFRRNNPGSRCERMEKRHAAECFALAEKWCQEKICEEIGFTHETSAIQRAFDRFEELGLDGLVLFTDGRLTAFSIYDRLNRNTADVHFEKYDPGIKGSAQAINWETACALQGRYEFLNREQDLGIEGLRKAKRSYCPAFTVKTYLLRRRGEASKIPSPESRNAGGSGAEEA